jgi:hypothetical protein
MKRYVACFFLTLTAALLLKDQTHLFLFPATLTALALIDRRAFRIFLKWKLWLLFLLLVAIPVLLVGTRDARWFGLPYNSAMLHLNLIMVERSMIIMLAVKMLTNRLTPEILSGGLKRLRLHQFEQVFSLAQTMLPELRDTVRDELKEVEWRKAARSPASMTTLLSRLVAKIVFYARRRSHHALPDEGS